MSDEKRNSALNKRMKGFVCPFTNWHRISSTFSLRMQHPIAVAIPWCEEGQL
jgi:hypothetical protein